MILLTSDLDRTIIYSEKMLNMYPIEGESVPVEQKGDKSITFMSKNSVELLKEFNQKHLFVPVTTRALYQYERINIISKEISPKYSIVSNGGTILVDGKVDTGWNEYIRRKLSTTSLPKEDMLKAFSKIRHEEWVSRDFYIDEFFFMFHVNKEHVPHTELASFEVELKKIGWRIFLHGHKLYVLPSNLDKAQAVARLKGYLDYDIHVAAGDSLMDYEMIAGANIGFSPKHGELFKLTPEAPRVNWLTRKGANSTEELLSIINKLNLTVTR